MRLHYLEIVTPDADAVCAEYAAVHGVRFGAPEPALGNARTAPLAGGGLLGVRPPMRDTETPVVRPYWRVEDIAAAVAAVAASGGDVALPPMTIPGQGACAIHLRGGTEHGLWQNATGEDRP